MNAELHKFVSNNCVNIERSIANLKTVKNTVEQEGFRSANIRDCAALMKYFGFLEEQLAKADHGLDEWTGSNKLGEYRAMGELFKGLSF